ncbi:MAG: Rrf2 family transcriptional regulator [Hyphomicrobiales bacterium]|nr:Rrf2 family transcriptional regulator [Hyphomicrobiales bacterium]MDE2016095.1 Rrf2 family transcriptional regulator [Hyphomicrobiales bacterium]
MMLLPRRSLLAIAAVVDVALHARPKPVAAKALAARHDLPPRHLETLLQSLVRAGILKGVRGPRGGYELARDRRRVTAAGIVRAVEFDPEADAPRRASPLMSAVVEPKVVHAGETFLAELEKITVEDLCREATERGVFETKVPGVDFTI